MKRPGCDSAAFFWEYRMLWREAESKHLSVSVGRQVSRLHPVFSAADPQPL
jgi:hypothetical protein